MIDFKHYMNNQAQALDLIGTTSYGFLARAIWRSTWNKGRLAWFKPYHKRAHLSTHTAMVCIGKDGRKWIIEMDMTRWQPRYVSKDRKEIFGPEDLYDIAGRKDLDTIRVFSGVKLTKPEEYFTDKIRDPHVCWIGRFPGFNDYTLNKGNEWLFETYREGVPYDLADILGEWVVTKKLKISGSSNVYICSELAQRCFEHICVLQKTITTMDPRDWQEFPFVVTVESMGS